MSRSQQDTVIDDDEETCPLCIEEFDLSDKNFRPCPCGYQICQFCFNSLKTTYEKSTCPNCRRIYDEKTIQYKIPTAEEFKLDQQNKLKKQAASKRKETEKREVETSSRRNLAGVRVKQQNLVYVIGLVPSIKDENMLLQTLRGQEYFGQYGEIEKIVVSKAKPGAVNQGVGVYVTYTTKEAAATCINVVDGSMNGDRVLRAQFGTTKYCSAYLRGEVCNNKNCSFLHETGEDGQATTLQNETMQTKTALKTSHSSQTSHYQPPTRQSQPVPPSTASSASSSQPMVRQSSKDEPDSRKGSTDASALPSSVSWANPNAPVIRTRRTSQAASRSSPSPQIPSATVASQKPEASQDETSDHATNPPPPRSSTPPTASSASNPPSKMTFMPEVKEPRKRRDSLLDQLITSVNSPEFRFIFDDSAFSPEELAALERHSLMIDPCGGAKLRLKREREEAERAKQEAEVQVKTQAMSQIPTSANDEVVDDEPFEGGSLALGGEPEDNPRTVAARSAIQRPSQPTSANPFLHEQFSIHNGRSLTPQQRQQMSLMGSSNPQQTPGLGHPMAQSFGANNFEFEQRSGLSQAQAHHEAFHGHARQHSRFNFSNDSAKPNTSRYPTQQPSAGSQHFYTSGVQGPPPGLKTAGTPPISGGGMFAQGHGFTSNMSAGFGTLKDNNTEMLMRGRSGTNTGHDVSKREYLLSLQNTNLRSPPPSAPGLLNPLYGQYTGAYQDPGLVKQKKKGKKHRHANTSSSGGGVVDLADPSIMQARLHQSGAGAGQGLFGGQNQDDIDFPPLAPVPVPRVLDAANTLRSHVHSVRSSQDSTARSSTPKAPPGLSLPHAHPSPAQGQGVSPPKPLQNPVPTTPGQVTPAVPVFLFGPRVPTPKTKPRDEPVVEVETVKEEASKVESNILKPEDPTVNASQESKGGNSVLHPPENVRITANLMTANALEKAVTGNWDTRATDNPSTFVDVSPSMERSAESVTKLDLASVSESKVPSAGQSPVADQTPILAASIVATPPAISRPGTPATAASRGADFSAMCPKTLRITSAVPQKPDTTPASAVTEKSMSLPSAPGKQRSRQPSVSSISRSRPSTPAISDHGYSNDVSRASSPPPSIVGSAPERSKSKNQIRKERKSKGREATETNSEGPPTPVERKVEEQQPIVARQKKKRKTQDRSTGDDDSSPTVAADITDRKMPAAPELTKGTKQQSYKSTKGGGNGEQATGRAEDTAVEAALGKKPRGPGIGKEEKATSNATPKEAYTLNQLLIESGKANDPETFKKLLDEHVSNIQTLFSQLFESKQLDQSSALFNLPPLTSYRLPPDSRRGADYLDGNGYTMSSPFGEVYLDSKHKRALQQGSVVRIPDPSRGNDLLRRTLITKHGRVYRHLSQEEEDRVLMLERRREEYEQKYGELGTKEMLKVDEADHLNLQGGLDELLKHGDRHGISWVMDESANIDGDLDDENAAYALGGDEPGELADLTGGWRAVDPLGSIAATANSKEPTAARPRMPNRSLNLRTMDIEKLQRTIKETQMEMEHARKEMETVEKKWVKKGKEAAKWREAMLKGKVMVGSD